MNSVLTQAEIDRFWSRCIKADGCWLWSGGVNSRGYGVFSVWRNGKNKSFRAHRLAYELVKGAVSDGMMICHACDTPLCVRPDHLFEGTAHDNMQDCLQKGRFRAPGTRCFGVVNGSSRLTWEKVREIRARFASGNVTKADLSRQYGITRQSIGDVIDGTTWRE
jgi:hypothetical protein